MPSLTTVESLISYEIHRFLQFGKYDMDTPRHGPHCLVYNMDKQYRVDCEGSVSMSYLPPFENNMFFTEGTHSECIHNCSYDLSIIQSYGGHDHCLHQNYTHTYSYLVLLTVVEV